MEYILIIKSEIYDIVLGGLDKLSAQSSMLASK